MNCRMIFHSERINNVNQGLRMVRCFNEISVLNLFKNYTELRREVTEFRRGKKKQP